MILYLAADLLWATRIKATAESLGLAARPVRSIEMLEARLADCEPRAVLLDLEAPDAALAMLARLRGPTATDRERAIRTLAWSPHVHRELMEQARAAGADEVLPRGAFDRNLPEILTKRVVRYAVTPVERRSLRRRRRAGQCACTVQPRCRRASP